MTLYSSIKLNRVIVCNLRSSVWLSLVFISLLSGEIVQNPRFETLSLGVEGHVFRWQQNPLSEGFYGEGEEQNLYTLKGNGHGVYWCWDGAAMARIPAVFDDDFTFTVKLKANTSELEPAQYGIIVKASTDTRSPSLSLRWDTHWENTGNSGLTWFNRLTPTNTIELGHVDEKGCGPAPGPGCQGQGYENRVPGFERVADIWLRVRRVRKPGVSEYYLSARYDDEEEFKPIAPVAAPPDPCNRDNGWEGATFPTFLIPDAPDEKVILGLFVVGGAFGRRYVESQFEDISIEVPGELKYEPEKDFTQINTFNPEASWPMWYGPNGNFSSINTDVEIVDSLQQAIKLWESEELIQHGGKGVSDETTAHEGGGGASPVYHDGKIFMSYYDPTCPSCDDADEIILAIDAQNGKTLWKKVYEKSGRNVILKKSGLRNLTPCVTDGKIIATGSSGRMYALDTETGEEVWRAHTGVGKEGVNALVCGENTVVSNYGSLTARDTESGERLWGLSGQDGTPTLWKHNGTEYLVFGTNEGVAKAVELRTGSEVWSLQGVGEFGIHIPVNENYMVLNMGDWKGPGAKLTGFKISSEGVEKVWELPDDYTGPQATAVVVYQGHAYARLEDKIICINLESGEIKGEVLIHGVNYAGTYAMNGRIITEADANHQAEVFYHMFDADPNNFRQMGTAKWFPTHTYSSTYYDILTDIPVDGRLFIRGYYGIVCYDLRKYSPATSIQKPFFAKPKSPYSNLPVLQKTATGLRLLGLSDATVRIFDIQGNAKLVLKANGPYLNIPHSSLSPGFHTVIIEEKGVKKGLRLPIR